MMQSLYLLSVVAYLLAPHVVTYQTITNYQAAYWNWTQENLPSYSDQDYTDTENEVFVQNPERKYSESFKPSWVSALSQAWASPERTIDLASLGIDLGTVFDRLLSPAGIVNQFALSLTIQLMFIVGYIISGGELRQLFLIFSFPYFPQVLATDLSLLELLLDLFLRL